jgi:hypothetical protein
MKVLFYNWYTFLARSDIDQYAARRVVYYPCSDGRQTGNTIIPVFRQDRNEMPNIDRTHYRGMFESTNLLLTEC